MWVLCDLIDRVIVIVAMMISSHLSDLMKNLYIRDEIQLTLFNNEIKPNQKSNHITSLKSNKYQNIQRYDFRRIYLFISTLSVRRCRDERANHWCFPWGQTIFKENP